VSGGVAIRVDKPFILAGPVSAPRSKPWLAIIGLVASALVLTIATLGFRAHYLGWFGESVPNVARWGTDWQAWLDQQPVEHPAIVHLMPEGCPCRFFTGQHAADLSRRAKVLGYRRYQAGDEILDTDLADLLPTRSFPNSPGPLLALTGADGQIRYLGPYSDGLRCSAANSLVDDWLPLSRPGRILQVDASSCQCSGFGPLSTGG